MRDCCAQRNFGGFADMVILEGDRTMFLGVKVTLDPKSRFWRYNTESNPRGMVGRVVGKTPNGSSFFVKWSNGEENGYRQGDLKVLGVVVDVK